MRVFVSLTISLLTVCPVSSADASCREDVKTVSQERIGQTNQEIEKTIQKVQVLVDRGKFRSALRELNSAIKKRPDEAKLFMKRASVNQSLGKIKDMRLDLEQAIEADSNSPRILAMAGELLSEVDVEAAIAHLTNAIELESKYLKSYELRALAYMSKNELDQALRDIDVVLLKKPEDPFFNGIKGSALLNLGRYSQAIPFYSKSIDLKPWSRNYYDRAYCWRQEGDLNKAVEDYSAAIKLARDEKAGEYIDAIYERGQTWQELGEFERAISDFEICSKAMGDSPQGDLQIAWILATCPDDEIRDGKRAMKIASKLCDPLTCQIAEPLQVFAAANAEIGDFKNAIALQNRAIALSSFAPDFQKKGKRRLAKLKKKLPIREANVPLDVLDRQVQKTLGRIELHDALEVPADVLARSYLDTHFLRQMIPFAKSGGNVFSVIDGQAIELTEQNAAENEKIIDERMSIYKQAIEQRTYRKLNPRFTVTTRGDCDGWGISDRSVLVEQDGFELRISQGSLRHLGVVVESNVVFRHDVNTDVYVSGAFDNDKIVFVTPRSPGIFFGAKRRCTATMSPATEHNGSSWAEAYLGRANALWTYGEFSAAMRDIEKAIAIDETNPDSWLQRAYFLATCEDDAVRNGKQAVESAERAQELTKQEDPVLFETLAVAYAEFGDFKSAIQYQKKLIEMTPEELKPIHVERLRLFESHKSFRPNTSQRER